MKMFTWIPGRQIGSYWKFPILAFFLCDIYILRFPKGCSVIKHKDPVSEGFNHYRLNILLKKSRDPNDRMYTLGKVYRWWRFEVFRPDLYEHGLCPISDSMWLLSLGCRLKVNLLTAKAR